MPRTRLYQQEVRGSTWTGRCCTSDTGSRAEIVANSRKQSDKRAPSIRLTNVEEPAFFLQVYEIGMRVEITRVNKATDNVNTFQFLLKLGPFRRTLKRVVNISQQHSGITQLKSVVTQLVPFNTVRPSNLTHIKPVPRKAGHLTPGIPEHKKIPHFPKAMLHRPEPVRRGARRTIFQLLVSPVN